MGTSGRDRETRRELAKLTATFLNGLGIVIVAVGALTPLATSANGQFVMGSGLATAATGIISVLAGAIFHLVARGILRREYRR
ncbi:hypothetical protein [Aureimonas mangrovi]|uniref:hypothetical protein n=1 Tax=Aureimonas mangrovi TaxID=2758041 RepID=UPI00163D8A96|nr:hypothetical protein [Aureimonas mangrovi]